MNKKIFVILVLLSIVGIVFWLSLNSKKDLESPEPPDEVSQVDEDMSPELSGKDLPSDRFEESIKDEALAQEVIRDVSDTQEQSVFRRFSRTVGVKHPKSKAIPILQLSV